MKKSISNIGIALDKQQQRQINGGLGCREAISFDGTACLCVDWTPALNGNYCVYNTNPF
ncbi:hypothetical protein [uncultured Tenacibaculum sp.]|uniref:hypothetical protein n=1 Tax=uncultured Tenacibaculum sp. TaxID=174713 RepID=UPI0026199A98|nr:hypothetical protein [uncultured Tenacibaculum sp.]